ncbi:cAMP-binding protein [Vulgatibacter incomptus]|uniref:cAMP-binding protein n=1 Tax=Vulgatibacter incomptus TaxID=1391653 RepID=A0A0K1PBW8_9BACT|nr:cAMP-binding protein [Vulgatibacter incomptus]
MHPIVDALARCALFKDFSPTGLEIVAAIAQERVVPQGASIFVENMVGDSLYVLADGYVRICLRDANGRDRALGVLGEGDHFGELSLLTPGATRVVSAIAETEARIVEIRQKDFARLQAKKPQACLKLILAIAAGFGRNLSENRETLRSLLLSAAFRSS